MDKYLKENIRTLKEHIKRLESDDYEALSDLEQLELAHDLKCVLELLQYIKKNK